MKFVAYKSGHHNDNVGKDNEEFIIKAFNSWKDNELSRQWLLDMNYDLSLIKSVIAVKPDGFSKTDVYLTITDNVDKVSHKNLQVKLVSSKRGFNQIDKRWLAHYKKLWGIPSNVYRLLQHYVGELRPYKADTRDERRMFADEFTNDERDLLLKFLNNKKIYIISSILKGQKTQHIPDFMLIIHKNSSKNSLDWILKPIDTIIEYICCKDFIITAQGGVISLGKVTMQRKGGDGGRNTANMLQFKIDPTELFKI